jgi:hypothetical protein
VFPRTPARLFFRVSFLSSTMLHLFKCLLSSFTRAHFWSFSCILTALPPVVTAVEMHPVAFLDLGHHERILDPCLEVGLERRKSLLELDFVAAWSVEITCERRPGSVDSHLQHLGPELIERPFGTLVQEGKNDLEKGLHAVAHKVKRDHRARTPTSGNLLDGVQVT